MDIAAKLLVIRLQLANALMLDSQWLTGAGLTADLRFILRQPPPDRCLANIKTLTDMPHTQAPSLDHLDDVELHASVDGFTSLFICDSSCGGFSTYRGVRAN